MTAIGMIMAMMNRPKLTLKPRVDPATRPKVDPAKVALSEQLGWRFVDKGGRYIMQKLVVSYEVAFDVVKDGAYGNRVENRQEERSRTWVDVPLVPEAYCG